MTPENFVKIFERTCEKEGVLFVPDPARDKHIAKNLIKHHTKHYDLEILNKSAIMYLRGRVDSASIADFALSIREYRDKAINEVKSAREFKRVLEQTRERHERLKEKG